MSSTLHRNRWTTTVAAIVLTALFLCWAAWLYNHRLKPYGHPAICKEHLRRLSLALHSYHDRYQRFPPAWTVGSDGQPWHSWRVLILPELGEQDLFDAYRFDEPWNGPHNAKLAQHMPDVFGFPGEQGAKFLAVTGQYTAFPKDKSSRIQEFYDHGTANSLLLVEAADSDINWLEPRDIPYEHAMKQQAAPTAPRLAGRNGTTFMLLASGEARSFSGALSDRMLRRLLRVGPTGETRPAAPAEFPPQQDASAFARTDVLPIPTMSIAPDRNYLYCATFRVAWDRLRESPGAPVNLEPLPQIAVELNRLPYSLDNLDPNSYFTATVDAADVGKMTNDLHRRFPGAMGPITSPADERETNLVLFAYLLKSLPFADELDGDMTPLSFPDGSSTKKVASFGGAHDLIRVADYRTDEDFIIELKTESDRDVMLLAKMPAEATLQETIDKLLKRVASPNPLNTRFRLTSGESAVIPKLAFNIAKNYDELVGGKLVDNQFRKDRVAKIQTARQVTAFVLNERGAKLESTAEIEGPVGDIGDDPEPLPPPPKIRKFLFDRPFLLLLKEQKSSEPYFAVWLANTEFMKVVGK